jgi:hypothetical protein
MVESNKYNLIINHFLNQIACYTELLLKGIEPEHGQSFEKALKVGKPIFTEIKPSRADGLLAPSAGVNAFVTASKFRKIIFLSMKKLVIY